MDIVVHLVKAVLINGSKRLIKILYTQFNDIIAAEQTKTGAIIEE